MNILISQAAIDLIVCEEVSGQKTYEVKYRRPEWPGGASGVTIGIGYDVGAGVRNKAQLWADWRGHIPDEMIAALEPCIGVTGTRAKALLSSVQNVDVPWSAAMAVFENVDVPRWYEICVKALPNFETLPPDCKGVLLSLAYNRGASFSLDGDRFREMRAIRDHMIAKEFGRIADEFLSMKRLWVGKNLPGLLARRDHEAALFERGLTASPAKIPIKEPAVVATTGGAVIATAASYGASGKTIIAILIATIIIAGISYAIARTRS